MTTQQHLVDALRVWQLAQEADNDKALIVAGRVMATAIEAALREPSRQREEHLQRLEQRERIARQAARNERIRI